MGGFRFVGGLLFLGVPVGGGLRVFASADRVLVAAPVGVTVWVSVTLLTLTLTLELELLPSGFVPMPPLPIGFDRRNVPELDDTEYP